MGIEEMLTPQKFDGTVDLRVIEDGIILSHYSPAHRRHIVRFFPNPSELTAYLGDVVALFRAETYKVLKNMSSN